MVVKHLLFSCFIILMLASCTSKEEEATNKLYELDAQTSSQVKLLKSHLNSKRVKNANLLVHYAKIVTIRNPEYKEIASALASDATANGPLFETLEVRLVEAKGQLVEIKGKNLAASTLLIDEFENIYFAASLDNFNLVLTDPINVLADLSDGKLPRVEARSRKQSLAANSAKDLGTGSQLVGNPHYGHWQQNSSGSSFWAFYGQYAFLSSMMGNRPYSYGYWSQNRDYSYYSDVGRRQYSSPKQRVQQTKTETRAKKSFKQQGKSFKSPYAKSRSSGSKKTSVVRTPSKFNSSKSKYASKYGKSSNKKSTRSSYSSRSSSRSRSRGGGGK